MTLTTLIYINVSCSASNYQKAEREAIVTIGTAPAPVRTEPEAQQAVKPELPESWQNAFGYMQDMIDQAEAGMWLNPRQKLLIAIAEYLAWQSDGNNFDS